MDITFDLQEPGRGLPVKRGHLQMGQKNRLGNSIQVTSRYLEKDGKPWIPVMGEFHYSRYDRSLWEQELLKMKAGGIEIVSSYLIWIHHEESEGVFNFEDDRDLRYFVSLCQKHQLFFLARLGPWVHGEVRNGGFPDWILGKCLRTDHPEYLSYVTRLFQAYYNQLKGLLYEDGGPVIGIQLENELVDNPDHLLTLKKLAQKIGFLVPLYTVTAWAVSGVGQFPPHQVLPVFGSYPEAPWRQNTDPFERKPHYLFVPGRNDITIGSDLMKGFLANPSEEILEDYPYAYCELGPGVQATYHRRPVIRPYDLYSIMMITLAKGNNLPGYYVFHGGRNPGRGRTCYQESRDTGYPNDLPVISYDFQAPIGEYGFVRPSYDYYRILHLFLKEYGSQLAECEACYPDLSPRGRKDTFTPRTAIRADQKGCGYVFFNTNQRNEQLEPAKNIQLYLKGEKDGKGQGLFVRPVDIPHGITCFFPINRWDGGVKIRYALMQPITEMVYDNDRYLFFMAVDGIPPEILFQGEMKVASHRGRLEKREEGLLFDGFSVGLEPVISYTAGEMTTRIVVLKSMDALRLYRFEHKGQPHIFLSDARMYMEKDQLVLYGEAPEGVFEFGVFPPLKLDHAQLDLRQTMGIFTFSRIPLVKCEAKITLDQTESAIFAHHAHTPYLFAENLEETREYLLHVEVWQKGDMDDIKICMDGEFDVMQIYEGEELTGDNFHLGGLTEIGIKRYEKTLKENRPLRLKLSPYSTGKEVFVEQKIERDVVSLALYQWIPHYRKELNPL